MVITYQTESGVTYKLVYITVRKMFYSKKIGGYPTIITQCLLYRDFFLLLGFSQVQKCQSDLNNTRFAHFLVTKKISHLIQTKKSRKNIWEQLLKKFN
jgi:hypothetical protein